jgi:hypothetical protein
MCKTWNLARIQASRSVSSPCCAASPFSFRRSTFNTNFTYLLFCTRNQWLITSAQSPMGIAFVSQSETFLMAIGSRSLQWRSVLRYRKIFARSQHISSCSCSAVSIMMFGRVVMDMAILVHYGSNIPSSMFTALSQSPKQSAGS